MDPRNPWENPQKVLVVLAHPDDPEFFCGGTLAAWVRAGHLVSYCLLTCGDKGSDDRDLSSEALCENRQVEQRAAAKVIGVEHVRFLSHEDGYLVPDLQLRREITRVIRQEKPDVLVTCDPRTLFFGTYRINHPDHRAAGQAALDAVFPASGNHRYFADLLDEGLQPHFPSEIWISLTNDPDVIVDVTDLWEVKTSALLEHRSQIGEPDKFRERMQARHTSDTTPENPRYEERFRVINFR